MVTDQFQEDLQLAMQHCAEGNFTSGIAIVNKILDEQPQSFQAKLILAVAYSRMQNFDGSLAILVELQQRDPNNPIVLHFLAIAYWQLNNPGLAHRFILEAIRLERNNNEMFYTLSNISLALQNPVEAEKAARECLRLKPDISLGYRNLGEALFKLGRENEAIEWLQKAIESGGDESYSRVILASIYRRLNDQEKVAELLQAASEWAMTSDEALIYHANNLYRNRFSKEGRECYEELYKRNPKNASVLRNLGSSYRMEGKFGECARVTREAIDIEPDSPRSYFDYLYSTKTTSDDYWALQALLKLSKKDWKNYHDKALVHYGLGKYYSDLHDYENAAQNFVQANDSMLKTIDKTVFDLSTFRDRNSFAINTFTPEFIEKQKSKGSPSHRPIFILGMIRSGTTLMEQIISSHSKVAAGGEIDYLLYGTNQCFFSNGTFNVKGFEKIQEDYLRLLDSIDANSEKVTDKMPMNCMLVGLIYLLFPHAKVIHTIRDPGDTCLSVYTTPYLSAVPYAHSRQSVVGVYREYKRLMDHWKKVLPKGFILDVQYEKLVENVEDETKKVLKYCGLGWEDQCLDYTSKGKAILTPSTWQVRQPLYTTSIGRWRHFARWFPEFARISEDA